MIVSPAAAGPARTECHWAVTGSTRAVALTAVTRSATAPSQAPPSKLGQPVPQTEGKTWSTQPCGKKGEYTHAADACLPDGRPTGPARRDAARGPTDGASPNLIPPRPRVKTPVTCMPALLPALAAQHATGTLTSRSAGRPARVIQSAATTAAALACTAPRHRHRCKHRAAQRRLGIGLAAQGRCPKGSSDSSL